MKKILVSLFALASLNGAYGQKTVVVLEPVVSGDRVTDMQKAIIRATLEEAITAIGGYEVVSTDAKLNCTTQITAEGEDFLVKASLVEANGGRIMSTVSELMKTTPKTDLQEGCKRLAKRLTDAAGKVSASAAAPSAPPAAPAAPAAPEIITIKPDGIEMVFVEGSQSLAGFYIGKYEVTQDQWMEVMGNNPSQFKGGNYPVENVSWNNAKEFISQLNAKSGRQYRLPTETEWLFAAMEGNKNSAFNYSGGNNIKEMAWSADNSDNTTHPVGKKKPNALGLYDMTGNVWEWCSDNYDADGKTRTSRGGSYNDYSSRCKITTRSGNGPAFKFGDLGFRLVLTQAH